MLPPPTLAASCSESRGGGSRNGSGGEIPRRPRLASLSEATNAAASRLLAPCGALFGVPPPPLPNAVRLTSVVVRGKSGSSGASCSTTRGGGSRNDSGGDISRRRRAMSISEAAAASRLLASDESLGVGPTASGADLMPDSADTNGARRGTGTWPPATPPACDEG